MTIGWIWPSGVLRSHFHDLQKKFDVKRLCWQGLFITEMSFHYCWIRRQGYKCVLLSLCCPTFDGFPLISWSSILSSSLSAFSWHHFLWNITETEWLGKNQSKNGRVTYNLGTLGSICSKNKVSRCWRPWNTLLSVSLLSKQNSVFSAYLSFQPRKIALLIFFFFFSHSCLFSAFTQDVVNIRIRKLLMVYYYFWPGRKLALTSTLICECNSSCSCQSSCRSSKTGNSPGHPTCGHNGFRSLGLHRRQYKTQITK